MLVERGRQPGGVVEASDVRGDSVRLQHSLEDSREAVSWGDGPDSVAAQGESLSDDPVPSHIWAVGLHRLQAALL